MTDPITLAAVSAVALSEGIKFLYSQAGEALKHRRKRATDEDAASAAVNVPVDAFDRPAQLGPPDSAAVDALESDLRALRQALIEYADGTDAVSTGDERLLDLTDALRRVLEVVYRQSFVFKGESRDQSDSFVSGLATVGDVHGYVAAVRARRIADGSVIGRVVAREVGPGGQAIGVDADTIG